MALREVVRLSVCTYRFLLYPSSLHFEVSMALIAKTQRHQERKSIWAPVAKPIIQATQEVEIRRTTVGSQHR
jgi:hypothetical protein